MTAVPTDVLEIAIERAESLVHRLRTGEITGFVIVGLHPNNDAALMHGGVFDTAVMVGYMEKKKQLLLQTFTMADYKPGGQLQAVAPTVEKPKVLGPQPAVAFCLKCERAFTTDEEFQEHVCRKGI